MARNRPFDDGNMQQLDSELRNRQEVVLIADPVVTIIDPDTTANTEYICKAQCGAKETAPVWQIMRKTDYGANGSKIEWAEGNGRFEHIANNRDSLNYR